MKEITIPRKFQSKLLFIIRIRTPNLILRLLKKVLVEVKNFMIKYAKKNYGIIKTHHVDYFKMYFLIVE